MLRETVECKLIDTRNEVRAIVRIPDMNPPILAVQWDGRVFYYSPANFQYYEVESWIAYEWRLPEDAER